jgi:hypothetical protein
MAASRLNGIQEVSGSIPLISTKMKNLEIRLYQRMADFLSLLKIYTV